VAQIELPAGPGHKVQQARSRRTYDALIKTGFDLLEKHEFSAITIAALAKAAGYSVGAFYARFKSKDEFLEAMVAQHVLERCKARERILASSAHDDLVHDLIADLVKYYWRRRRFWRAVVTRSTSDPDFFSPISRNASEYVELVTKRIESDAERELTKAERANVGFAIHIVLGTINNRLVNRPQPSLLDKKTFVEQLTRAFHLVADYAALNGGMAGARRAQAS